MPDLLAELAAGWRGLTGRSRYAAWNIKALGTALAGERYRAGLAGAGVQGPPDPVLVGLTSGLCRQADIEAPWLRHWCGRLGMAPIYHRKVWEDCFVVQALWEADMLGPGRRGLGFAVGSEALPSFFAAEGAEVLATDLDPARRQARHWIRLAQHGADRERLFRPELLDRAAFDARVAQQPLDMNAIPAELHGGFDFCWSVCAFEHLGSTGHGLRFVENAMRCLRPGGLAVHTTEYNLDPAHGHAERGGTVLFEPHHVAALQRRLHAAGHQVLAVNLDPGDGVLDGFVDVPPYNPPRRHRPAAMPVSPHLRLQVKGLAATSLGLIIRAGG